MSQRQSAWGINAVVHNEGRRGVHHTGHPDSKAASMRMEEQSRAEDLGELKE